MKISVGHYAKTLYEMTKGKDEPGVDEIIRGFARILAKNGQLRLKKSIIERFEKIYNEKNGIVKSEVISKIELGDSSEANIKSMLKNKYIDKEIVVEKKKDASMKGGMIIKSGDDMLDGSINNQLTRLKSKLVA